MRHNGGLFPEPENEAEVEYLFHKNHKKLGYGKILKISHSSTPDIIAKRGNKKVWIELEYKLSSFKYHYFVFKQEMRYSNVPLIYKDGKYILDTIQEWKYNKEREFWEKRIITKEGEDIGQTGEKHDPKKELTTTNEDSVLIYKSLNSNIDIIICWIEDCKINDNLEVINLREQLEMINGLDRKQLTLDGFML